MTENEIYDQLTKVFREVFADDEVVLRPDTSAKDIEGWDSYAHISLIVAAEVQFGIKMRTGEIENLNSVGDLVDLIMRRTTS